MTGSFTASFGGGNAVAGALGNQTALEMRNGAEDVENQFARGRCGVDSFFEADQVNAADLEAFDGIEQFFEGAAEAIETGNAEAVAGPGMVDQFRQGRTLEPSARDHVDEHANGAGLPQPILLAGGILCRSRDPGITEDVTVAGRAVRLLKPSPKGEGVHPSPRGDTN